MDYFGINSADELPQLREMAEQAVEPTAMKDVVFGESVKPVEPGTDAALSVTEGGELIINKEMDSEDES